MAQSNRLELNITARLNQQSFQKVFKDLARDVVKQSFDLTQSFDRLGDQNIDDYRKALVTHLHNEANQLKTQVTRVLTDVFDVDIASAFTENLTREIQKVENVINTLGSRQKGVFRKESLGVLAQPDFQLEQRLAKLEQQRLGTQRKIEQSKEQELQTVQRLQNQISTLNRRISRAQPEGASLGVSAPQRIVGAESITDVELLTQTYNVLQDSVRRYIDQISIAKDAQRGLGQAQEIRRLESEYEQLGGSARRWAEGLQRARTEGRSNVAIARQMVTTLKQESSSRDRILNQLRDTERRVNRLRQQGKDLGVSVPDMPRLQVGDRDDPRRLEQQLRRSQELLSEYTHRLAVAREEQRKLGQGAELRRLRREFIALGGSVHDWARSLNIAEQENRDLNTTAKRLVSSLQKKATVVTTLKSKIAALNRSVERTTQRSTTGRVSGPTLVDTATINDAEELEDIYQRLQNEAREYTHAVTLANQAQKELGQTDELNRLESQFIRLGGTTSEWRSSLNRAEQEGRSVVATARRMTAGLERYNTELATQRKRIRESSGDLNKFEQKLKEFNETAKRTTGLDRNFRAIGLAAQQATSRFSKWDSVMSKWLIRVGIFGAVRFILQDIGRVIGGVARVTTELARNAAELQDAERGFRNLAGQTTNASVALIKIRAAAGGVVDDFTLLNSATKAALAGLDVSRFDELVRGARALAAVTGREVPDAIERLTEAIAKQERRLLDELGIVVRAEDLYRNYAEANDIAASSLTAHQKVLAFFEGTMTAVNSKVQQMGGILEDAQRPFFEFDEAVRTARLGLGRWIGQHPVFITALKSITDVVKGFGRAFEDPIHEIDRILVRVDSARTQAAELRKEGRLDAGQRLTRQADRLLGQAQTDIIREIRNLQQSTRDVEVRVPGLLRLQAEDQLTEENLFRIFGDLFQPESKDALVNALEELNDLSKLDPLSREALRQVGGVIDKNQQETIDAAQKLEAELAKILGRDPGPKFRTELLALLEKGVPLGLSAIDLNSYILQIEKQRLDLQSRIEDLQTRIVTKEIKIPTPEIPLTTDALQSLHGVLLASREHALELAGANEVEQSEAKIKLHTEFINRAKAAQLDFKDFEDALLDEQLVLELARNKARLDNLQESLASELAEIELHGLEATELRSDILKKQLAVVESTQFAELDVTRQTARLRIQIARNEVQEKLKAQRELTQELRKRELAEARVNAFIAKSKRRVIVDEFDRDRQAAIDDFHATVNAEGVSGSARIRASTALHAILTQINKEQLEAQIEARRKAAQADIKTEQQRADAIRAIRDRASKRLAGTDVDKFDRARAQALDDYRKDFEQLLELELNPPDITPRTLRLLSADITPDLGIKEAQDQLQKSYKETLTRIGVEEDTDLAKNIKQSTDQIEKQLDRLERRGETEFDRRRVRLQQLRDEIEADILVRQGLETEDGDPRIAAMRAAGELVRLSNLFDQGTKQVTADERVSQQRARVEQIQRQLEQENLTTGERIRLVDELEQAERELLDLQVEAGQIVGDIAIESTLITENASRDRRAIIMDEVTKVRSIVMGIVDAFDVVGTEGKAALEGIFNIGSAIAKQDYVSAAMSGISAIGRFITSHRDAIRKQREEAKQALERIRDAGIQMAKSVGQSLSDNLSKGLNVDFRQLVKNFIQSKAAENVADMFAFATRDRFNNLDRALAGRILQPEVLEKRFGDDFNVHLANVRNEVEDARIELAQLQLGDVGFDGERPREILEGLRDRDLIRKRILDEEQIRAEAQRRLQQQFRRFDVQGEVREINRTFRDIEPALRGYTNAFRSFGDGTSQLSEVIPTATFNAVTEPQFDTHLLMMTQQLSFLQQIATNTGRLVGLAEGAPAPNNENLALANAVQRNVQMAQAIPV